MDEIDLLRTLDEPPAPSGEARARAERAIRAVQAPPVGVAGRLRQGVRRVALLGGLATAAVMTQPHIPLQLPGHRALGWLGLLFMMRLVGGTGWASAVGLASAVGTMAIGRSPNGSFWGVLQYVVAGVGVDAFLSVRPRWTASPVRLALLGALILMLVGWITPVSNSFVAGVGVRDIWVSLASIQASGWARLLGYDLAFGAGAGLVGYALAWVLAAAWRPAVSGASLPREV